MPGGGPSPPGGCPSKPGGGPSAPGGPPPGGPCIPGGGPPMPGGGPSIPGGGPPPGPPPIAARREALISAIGGPVPAFAAATPASPSTIDPAAVAFGPNHVA